jgi:hypothetical protein
LVLTEGAKKQSRTTHHQQSDHRRSHRHEPAWPPPRRLRLKSDGWANQAFYPGRSELIDFDIGELGVEIAGQFPELIFNGWH